MRTLEIMAWGALLRPLMGSFATEIDMSSCQVRILNWVAKGANRLHDACPIDISPQANFLRNVKTNMPMIDKSSSNEPKQIILAAIFRKEPYKWALGRVVHSLPHLTSASKIFETGSSNWYQPLMSTGLGPS